jgi:carbon-monoxide dehydrogenase large subunit
VQSTGQGHATTFPLLLAQRLGISPQQIQHRHGDSALELAGYASVGSRAAMVVSNTTLKLTDVMLAKGKAIAATALEAAETDIDYGGGRFNVVGTDRSISLFELAARAREMKQRGEIPEDLDTKGNAETPLTFPNGCHVAELEIDPATGNIEFASYVAVDDCGNALNRMIVEGQVHGSVAQGLGQALLEEVIYDTESGQLVTGSFMDYGIPHADDMPAIKEALHLVPARTNPLGVKGAGEAGTTAAIAAVMNGIADAIPDGGGVHLDMPATPEKVWRACRAAMA